MSLIGLNHYISLTLFLATNFHCFDIFLYRFLFHLRSAQLAASNEGKMLSKLHGEKWWMIWMNAVLQRPGPRGPPGVQGPPGPPGRDGTDVSWPDLRSVLSYCGLLYFFLFNTIADSRWGKCQLLSLLNKLIYFPSQRDCQIADQDYQKLEKSFFKFVLQTLMSVSISSGSPI